MKYEVNLKDLNLCRWCKDEIIQKGKEVKENER